MIQLLNCSSDLGSCCQSRVLSSIMGIFNSIITIVQIVVPILLLLMVCVNLAQLLMDPDDKKKVSSIKNKFIAAVVVFFVPLFVSVTMNIVSDNSSSNFNLAACMKESKNIKVNTKVTYSNANTEATKRKNIITDSSNYEPGKPSGGGTTSSGNVSTGEKISVGEAIVGDDGVKLRENIYHKKSAINKKLNNQEVVNYALSWVGKMSYHHGATGELRPGGTCDCSHFIYKVFQHFGAVEGDWIYCSVWGSGNVKGTTLYSNPSKLVPGDVVYKYYSKYAQHVEIYLGNNRSVGCNGGKGVNTGGNVSKYFDTFIHINAYD